MRRSIRGPTIRWATRRATSSTAFSGRFRSCSRRTIRTCSTRRRTCLPIARRRAELGGDQPRSHAARSPNARRLGRPDHEGPDRRVEYYATIFTLAESPRTRGVIWTGSDDGLVHLTRDGGTHLAERDAAAGCREWIAHLDHRAVALHDRGDGLRRGEPVPARRPAPVSLQDDRLRQDVDADRDGHSGRGVRARDPRGSRAARAALRRHRARRVGVASTTARTGRSLRRNLPPVPVHDLAVKDGDLVAATHGRAFWCSTTSRRCGS